MRRLIYICILLVLSLPLAAQNERLTIQLHDVLFSDFVDTLENKVLCKVLYADDWVDSLYISVDAKHEELGQVMAHALAGSGLTFFVTGNNQVILFKGHTLKTNFREEYTQYLADHMSKTDTTKYSLSGQVEEEESDISEEFRLYKIGNPAEMEREGKVELSGTILY
ncbi:MAG: STN domain-containing protein, partial [Bacteroidales bacterium]|nr:STN domain-containing protein [Bacteroidales bacterium]